MLQLKLGKEKILVEKFGFTPKYNEDTGEIDRYVYIMKSIDKVGIIVKRWNIEIIETYTEVLEVLYDLIKAGIVIKEEKPSGSWSSLAFSNLMREILKLINNYAEENQTDYEQTMAKIIVALEELKE